jgi:hypothetical protein
MRTGVALLVVLAAAVGLRSEEPGKGEGWEALFNGKDTAGWKLRSAKTHQTRYLDAEGKVVPGARVVKKDGRPTIVDAKGQPVKGGKPVLEETANPSGWAAEGGALVCVKPHHGNDLLTDKKFTDFDLHVEFLATSNSGVYLQGRYEIQVDNSYGQKPGLHSCGAVYGRIAPRKNMAKKPTEWQSYDVAFRAPRGKDGKVTQKARVTLVWNGEKVIDNAEIDGPTGAALDNKVLEPGPLLLQGDHGKVSYRNIKIRPRPAK